MDVRTRSTGVGALGRAISTLAVRPSSRSRSRRRFRRPAPGEGCSTSIGGGPTRRGDLPRGRRFCRQHFPMGPSTSARVARVHAAASEPRRRLERESQAGADVVSVEDQFYRTSRHEVLRRTEQNFWAAEDDGPNISVGVMHHGCAHPGGDLQGRHKTAGRCLLAEREDNSDLWIRIRSPRGEEEERWSVDAVHSMVRCPQARPLQRACWRRPVAIRAR